MTREREIENLTRELLNYNKLQLISMVYKMAERMAMATVQSSTGKAPAKWEGKEFKLHKKLTFQAIEQSMFEVQKDRE